MKRAPHIFAMCISLAAAPLTGCAGDLTDESGEEPVATDEEELTLPSYCNDVLTTDPAFASFENQVFDLTNQRRTAGATCGTTAFAPAPALTFDARLQCAARKQSKDMATHNFFSHTGSDGTSFSTRIKNAGYTFRAAAENIAAGQTTPSAVVNAWMNSSGHCTNIMNPNLKNLGVGYFFNSSADFDHYWTQDFGTLL
jgi:uncharacterized protein YkwD